MNDIVDFIHGLPKAELHLHIEGTLEPEMLFAFAADNGVALPYPSVEALRQAYDFENLQDFLDLYYQGTNVLMAERDFFRLTRAYLERAYRQHIRHVEVFFDPQAHTRRGVPFTEVLGGIHWALAEGAETLGISWRLIMCFLRDLDADDAMATLEDALEHKDVIAGVGLDSAEAGHPPGGFEAVFRRARAEGFHAVAHAGEEGPAAYVEGALTALGVERIDHGNRALDDDDLVHRLAEARVPLTMCPLSNLRLGVVKRLADHPLKALMQKGILVTVNSDDPAYFGGYLDDNYRAVADGLGLTRDDLLQLARNSFEASFLDDADKTRLIAEVDAYGAAAESR